MLVSLTRVLRTDCASRAPPLRAQASSQEEVENILLNNSTPAAERLLWQRGASDAQLKKRYGIVRGARLLASGVPMADVVARTSAKSADIRSMFPAAKRNVKAARGPGRTSTRDAVPAFKVLADAAVAATPTGPKRAAAGCSKHKKLKRPTKPPGSKQTTLCLFVTSLKFDV